MRRHACSSCVQLALGRASGVAVPCYTIGRGCDFRACGLAVAVLPHVNTQSVSPHSSRVNFSPV